MDTTKKIITTPNAPKPIGPYSQATVANGFVYVAGSAAVDPGTNKWLGGGIKEQTRQTLENVKAILEASGSSLEKVMKVNIYLRKKELFGEMNEVYSTYFANDRPARTTVITDLLLDDMLIEIDCVALL